MRIAIHQVILLLSVLCGAAIPVAAEVSIGIGIGLPNVSIGINVPAYPDLQPIPGYPVYYAPQLGANFFFYDGMYWAFQDDNWYASSWYNGPWAMVSPMVVPVYILQVPVRYYRYPPAYFRGAPPDAPPRWGDHWGNDWQRQRSGWDHLDRNSAPPPAPLPTYQRQYSGSSYPSVSQQRTITAQNYRYQPRDPVVKQHYERFVSSSGAAASGQKPSPKSPQDQTSRPNHAQQASGSAPGPSGDVVSTPKPPKQPRESQQPANEEHAPGVANAPKPPPPRHEQQQPPGEPNSSPGQIANAGRPPQQQHPQSQSTAPERNAPPAQGEKASREPKQDQGKEETGDKRPDKEEPHDNR